MTDTDRGKETDDEVRPDGGTSDSPPECHRRGCSERASFLVLERYQEETGHGPVEAEAALCQAHADDESPTNLDDSYPGYVFRVEPLGDATDGESA